ncbi:MAG: LamG-like jellyroll fold domain-containing protein, partial [Planctomycetota bacterium]
TAGEWAHLGVVFDGGGAANADRLKLYINGTQRTLTYAGTIPATTTDSTANLLLGYVDTGGADLRYDDYLGSIALWDVALSATEMAYLGGARTRLMPSQVQPANLVLYYLMNEGPDGTSADGDTLRDSSDSGNTGTGQDGANNTGLDWQAGQVLSYP